jgi:sec-independent protein translocase protein TatB
VHRINIEKGGQNWSPFLLDRTSNAQTFSQSWCFDSGRIKENMSFSEMFFLVFLALIVFGPKRLPEMARKLGKIVGEFRRASNDFRAQIEDEVRKLELTDAAKSMGTELKQATQSVNRFPFDQILSSTNTSSGAQSAPAQTPSQTLDQQIMPPKPAVPHRDSSFDAVFESSNKDQQNHALNSNSQNSEEKHGQHA